MSVNGLCTSGHWEDDELDGLGRCLFLFAVKPCSPSLTCGFRATICLNKGLLGLQPCFEDVVLLAPIYVALIVGGAYRSCQCYRQGRVFELSEQRRAFTFAKIACAVCNAVANVVLLSVLKQGAPYEYLVYPLGVLGWISMVVMHVVSLKYFSFMGQWISRFLGLWVFVCFCIRWPSQYALGNDISGQEYYFQSFLAMWVPQAICVVLFYFEKAVTLEEWAAPSDSAASVDEQGTSERLPRGHMSFQAVTALEKATDQPAAANPGQVHMKLTRAEEDNLMRPIPWSDVRNPERRAGPLGRISYSWMSPLFKYAHKHDLEDYDVWDLRVDLRYIQMLLARYKYLLFITIQECGQFPVFRVCLAARACRPGGRDLYLVPSAAHVDPSVLLALASRSPAVAYSECCAAISSLSYWPIDSFYGQRRSPLHG